MLGSLPMLDRDDDGLPVLLARELRDGLLILGPQPRGDRFLDVLEGLLLVLALRDATGQGRTFNDQPSILSSLESDVKNHGFSHGSPGRADFLNHPRV